MFTTAKNKNRAKKGSVALKTQLNQMEFIYKAHFKTTTALDLSAAHL